jgi:hypothetical protein
MQPLAACGVMAAAVLGVREVLIALGAEHPAIYLFPMIVVGAAAYVGSALVIARETSRDLLSLLKQALRREKVPGDV